MKFKPVEFLTDITESDFSFNCKYLTRNYSKNCLLLCLDKHRKGIFVIITG